MKRVLLQYSVWAAPNGCNPGREQIRCLGTFEATGDHIARPGQIIRMDVTRDAGGGRRRLSPSRHDDAGMQRGSLMR